MFKFTTLLSFFIFAAALPALADSSAASGQSVSTATSAPAIVPTVGYLNELTGMSFKAPSGNTNGAGTNLRLDHYFSVGAKMPSKSMSFKLTVPFSQVINEVDEKTTGGAAGTLDKPFFGGDPYLTFLHTGVMDEKTQGIGLAFLARYYMPFGQQNAITRNLYKRNEAGRGTLRLLLSPSKSYDDGRLSVSADTYFHYRFSSHTDEERARFSAAREPYRDDIYLYFDPIVSYAVTPKFDAYLEYFSGRLTHGTDGKWSRFKDTQTIYYGAHYKPLKEIDVNPYFGMGPAFKDGIGEIAKNTAVGLILSYTIL